MPRFPDSFLDEIRQRITLESVARAHGIALKREGHELKGLSPFNKESTPSFTINEGKGLWKDFSSGKGGADVFSLEMALTGADFMKAVEALAGTAGVPIPDAGGPRRRQNLPPTSSSSPAPTAPAAERRESRPRGKRQLALSYDYVDADGTLLYQVCRFQFRMPDGSLETNERGRIKKTFGQRRPAIEPGRWVWGLDAGEYMRKGADGDWIRYDEKNFEAWNYTERAVIDSSVAHGLYRLPELIEERGAGEDARIIWLPEGEKDVETLVGWDLVSTTNSGGAKNWQDHHAQQFDGLDVVIPIDNDKAGRERGHKVASTLRGWAKSVKVLDWREHWVGAPEGADVTDWKEIAHGTREKLLAIVSVLPEWTPQPPESAFNAQRFIDLDAPAREYEWLIKKVLTRGETSVWHGPPSCGKSFLLQDASLAIARGVSWFRQRVRRGLVIFVAAEGGLGLRKRLRAWRKAHNVTADENLPFVLLPMPVNLFVNDTDLKKLLVEIRAWAAFYDEPLELVVLDTLAAVSAGANEISSEHMGLVLSRVRWLALETSAHIALVHHNPKEGESPRGWTGIVGNTENIIQVSVTDRVEEIVNARGERAAVKVRQFKTTKQKDEEDNFLRSFVLRQVHLGVDADGEPITSMVVDPLYGPGEAIDVVGSNTGVPPGYKVLRGNTLGLMKDLAETLRTKAIARKGKDQYHVYAVKISDWAETSRVRLYTNDPEDPHGKRLRLRVKKSIERTYDGGKHDWVTAGLIEKDGEFVWRTDRKVFGVDPLPLPSESRTTAPREDQMLLAPGEADADDPFADR